MVNKIIFSVLITAYSALGTDNTPARQILSIPSTTPAIFTSEAGNNFVSLHKDSSVVLRNSSGTIISSARLPSQPLRMAVFNKSSSIIAVPLSNGSLVALEVPSLKPAWNISLNSAVVSDIGIWKKSFAICIREKDSTMLLVIESSTGKTRNVCNIGGIAIAAPAMDDSSICVSTTDGNLVLINSLTGNIANTYSGGADYRAQSYTFYRGKVVAAADGSEKKLFLGNNWQADLPAAEETNEPEILRSTLFGRVEMRNTVMKAFAAKGRASDTSFFSTGNIGASMWVIDDNVGYISTKEPDYLARARYSLLAIDLQTGKTTTLFSQIRSDIASPSTQKPIITGKHIYAVIGGDTLVVLDKNSGTLERSIPLPSHHTASPVLAENSVILTSAKGELSMFPLMPDEIASSQFDLHQNNPNPFNPSTTLRFSTQKTGKVVLDIISIDGRIISRIIDKSMNPGLYTTNWNGTNSAGKQVAAGTYIARLSCDGLEKTIIMNLLK